MVLPNVNHIPIIIVTKFINGLWLQCGVEATFLKISQ